MNTLTHSDNSHLFVVGSADTRSLADALADGNNNVTFLAWPDTLQDGEQAEHTVRDQVFYALLAGQTPQMLVTDAAALGAFKQVSEGKFLFQDMTGHHAPPLRRVALSKGSSNAFSRECLEAGTHPQHVRRVAVSADQQNTVNSLRELFGTTASN